MVISEEDKEQLKGLKKCLHIGLTGDELIALINGKAVGNSMVEADIVICHVK